MVTRLLLSIPLSAILLATGPTPAAAATLPSGFTETLVANGLSNPTAMAFAPDGRLFVCQQSGQLRVIANGVLLTTPFVSLTVDSNGERGLLGVAFDPAFATNHYVYVYYTATTPSVHNRVSRFTANGNVAVAKSETVILELNNLSIATNHNGGAIHFGLDGKLYIGVGENANRSNAQTLTNLLGKILRINADGTIPTDNPFYTQATGQNRAIWALGLRNPFTFDVQPVTGRIFINDVGETTFEEIDDGSAGANYGWPNSEGPTTNAGETGPSYYYGHGTGPFLGCAITGAAFYNPPSSQFPASYTGTYFFADLCGGWINQYDPGTGGVATFASGIATPVDLHVASDGSLYYLARGSGSVYRVSFGASQAPTITQQPASQTVAPGQRVTFTVAASGTQPLSYQWQRNHMNIKGATSSSYTIAAATSADNGAVFRALVSNGSGSVFSNDAALTVTSGSGGPTITQQPASQTVAAGQPVTFTVAASGAQPLSYQWQRNHANIKGATGSSYTIPAVTSADNGALFRCVVSNGAGSTPSNDATLTVTSGGGP